MTINIIDGKQLATKILVELKKKVSKLPGQPGLAVILIGHDPASESYVEQKRRAAESIGINFQLIRHSETVETEFLLLEVARLNSDPAVHGIVVQLPLPEQIDKAAVLLAVDPIKDVDGFHPLNHGRNLLGVHHGLPPATPAGVLRLLDEHKVDLTGKEVVIVGHSNIVGKPLAVMLMNRNATVTVCHVHTTNLKSHTTKADLLISATGVPHLIKADMVKKGAIVIDVGTTKVNGRLLGDVDYEAVSAKASLITPVPGGVGPMTVASLMINTVTCAERIMAG